MDTDTAPEGRYLSPEEIAAYAAGEDMLIYCAEAAHEMNRIYCMARGDASQPQWVDAPDWQRSSAINNVRGALAGNTPEQSHEGWLAEKTATGWKYGPVKDPEKKEHPCLVPYAELPPEQQQKDYLFVTTVKAMAAALRSRTTPEELISNMNETGAACGKI